MKKNVLFVVLMFALVLVGCAEHEHVWDEGAISKEASCTEAGERIFTCETCKATRTEAIPATGHSYGFEVATPATCVENGVETEVCSVCKEKSGETRTIPAAHKYDADGVCSVCGAKKDEVEKAEARIGTRYYATLTDAIKSLKDKEDKTATITILVEKVVLEDFSTLTGSNDNSAWSIAFEGNGRGKTIIDISTDNAGEGTHQNYVEGAKLSFKNVTVHIGDSSNYQGLVRAGELVFDSCAIEGMGTYWGVGDVSFTNCEFKDNKDYSLWLYSGKNFVFENCSFTSSVGKFLHPYNEGSISLNVLIKDCSFENTSEAEESGKPIVNIKTQAVCKVSFEGDIKLVNIATGKQESKYFQVESDNGSVVLVDGEQVYPKN